MPFLPSMSDPATPRDIWLMMPELGRPMCEYHDILLRGPSPLTVAQRELIAAYVSGLNACHFCCGTHTAIAEGFGVEPGPLESLLKDLDGAEIGDEMRALLRYAAKLTLSPSRMTQADAASVFEAGWNETAFLHAVKVCCLFNFMNRLVFGTGIEPSDRTHRPTVERLRDRGYR